MSDLIEIDETDVNTNETTQTESVDSFAGGEDSRPEINSYSCGICKELMYRPVTLLCQHSYCYKCLETYYMGDAKIHDENFPDVVWYSNKKDKCPLCNIPYTLPPIDNTLLGEVLEHKFPEEYQARRQYVEHDSLVEEKKFEEDRQMRKEIWNSISTNFNRPNPEPIQFTTAHQLRQINQTNTSWSHLWDTMKHRFVELLPMIPVMGAATVFGVLTMHYTEKSLGRR